jgi:predicted metal-dependent hydrolase
MYTRHDGLESRWRFAMGMIKVLLIKPGYWRMVSGPVLEYYRPGFKPRSRNDSGLIAQARADLERASA